MARSAQAKVIFVPMNLFGQGSGEGSANPFSQTAILENMAK